MLETAYFQVPSLPGAMNNEDMGNTYGLWLERFRNGD